MIVKKNFNPIKVWSYIKFQATVSILWSFIISFLIINEFIVFNLNFAIVGILGSSLAIFIAFRNNASYSRWIEARNILSGILASSRIFARLIITFTNSHIKGDETERQKTFKKEIIFKLIAWINILRVSLRNEKDYSFLKKYLNENEINKIKSKNNKASYLLKEIGTEIYKAMGDGTLAGFDSFQLEGQLLTISNYQANLEKIKDTPMPKQYDFFTRMFVYLFIFILPFGLISFFNNSEYVLYLNIFFSFIISSIFIIMERTGAANENPFEGKVTDVPLTLICDIIENNLSEMLDIEVEEIKYGEDYIF